MAKFNTAATRPAAGNGPIVAEANPSTVTYEGGAGYVRDTKSELFLLGVANMVGEDTFYEKADDRDARFAQLVGTVAVDDVDWLTRFVRWLRTGANMRSAPLVAAAEAVHARLVAGPHGGNRELVAAAMDRADEPGEFLAYWTGRYGRTVPKPVKRGIADAVGRLYTERALLKYDTASRGFRFADVIDLTHPAPAPDKPWQGELFRYALDRRHGRDGAAPEALRTVRANARLRAEAAADPAVLLDADRLAAAGMTWEDVLSLAGTRLDKARLWSALVPSMGYMALLRNLRNFDEAGPRVRNFFAPPGMISSSRWWMRLTVSVRARPSSSRRSTSSRSTTVASSAATARRPGLRSPATATLCASTGSVLRPCPVSKTRTRADSFAGTSSTVSPSATSRWAMCRPIPAQPSTAHTRSLNRRPAASIA